VFKAGRPRRRLLALLVVAVVLVGAVVARVGLLQTVDKDDYASYGERQRVRSVAIPAERGTIFDRDGEVLALSVPTATIWADPRLIEDPAAAGLTLGAALAMTPEEVTALVARLGNDSEFEYVRRQVDDSAAEAVKALGLKGVYQYAEHKRFYPSEEVGRSVLGSTDPDGNGIAGLELQYDEELNGTPGELIRERDQQGRTIPTGRRQVVPAEPGDDLRLTIQRTLQYEVEQYLLSQVAQTQARGGMVLVMDVSTGDLLAVANVRVDDGGRPELARANLAAVDMYEIGSVNKVITAAAAIEEGTAGINTPFEVPYRYQFADHVFIDAVPHEDTVWTLEDIVVKSSNVGTIKLAETLGSERVDRYLRAFGVGEVTPLQFPGEARGLLPPHEKWRGTEKATIPYGQGVASTALQMVAAVNTIANDGTYVAPRLVLGNIDSDGDEHTIDEPISRPVISPETAAEMSTVLERVVCEGTATRAAIPGYTVAGKTGTAYKAQDNGTYVDAQGKRHYYASFVGYVPAEDPRFTVLVSIDEPQGNHYGGLVAAPLFVQAAQAALRQFDVPPPATGGGCPAPAGR
jgi:cell division protein FtsI (penicillin-binding protein 3)